MAGQFRPGLELVPPHGRLAGDVESVSHCRRSHEIRAGTTRYPLLRGCHAHRLVRRRVRLMFVTSQAFSDFSAAGRGSGPRSFTRDSQKLSLDRPLCRLASSLCGRAAEIPLPIGGAFAPMPWVWSVAVAPADVAVVIGFYCGGVFHPRRGSVPAKERSILGACRRAGSLVWVE